MFIHVVLWQNICLLQNMKNLSEGNEESHFYVGSLVIGGNGQIAGVSIKASYKYSTSATGIGAFRKFVYDNHFLWTVRTIMIKITRAKLSVK